MYKSFPVGDKSKIDVVMFSGCFYNVCFGGFGSQTADMARFQATKPNQHIFAASDHMKEGLFRGLSEVKFLFCKETVLFLGMRHPYFLSGASGNFCTS